MLFDEFLALGPMIERCKVVDDGSRGLVGRRTTAQDGVDESWKASISSPRERAAEFGGT